MSSKIKFFGCFVKSFLHNFFHSNLWSWYLNFFVNCWFIMNQLLVKIGSRQKFLRQLQSRCFEKFPKMTKISHVFCSTIMENYLLVLKLSSYDFKIKEVNFGTFARQFLERCSHFTYYHVNSWKLSYYLMLKHDGNKAWKNVYVRQNPSFLFN